MYQRTRNTLSAITASLSAVALAFTFSQPLPVAPKHSNIDASVNLVIQHMNERDQQLTTSQVRETNARFDEEFKVILRQALTEVAEELEAETSEDKPAVSARRGSSHDMAMPYFSFGRTYRARNPS